MRKTFFSFCFLFLLLTAKNIFCGPESVYQKLPLNTWQKREWSSAKNFHSTILPIEADKLLLPVTFPGRTEFVCDDKTALADWQNATHLQIVLQLPEKLPEAARLTVFTRDKDFLWRQHRIPLLKNAINGIVTLQLPIKNLAAERFWENKGHARPWNMLTSKLLQEYGLAFELESGAKDEFTGNFVLLSAELLQTDTAKEQNEVYDLAFAPKRPHIGERIEFSFRLNSWPADPFNPESADIKAEVLLPNGQKENIRAFFYEDFLYDSEQWDKTLCLSPYEAPQWKIRYCPRIEGNYKINIQATLDGKKITLPELTFRARASITPWDGFVRLDPEDDAFLQFDSGKNFWGLGVNVRSPYDQRYQQTAPYSEWQDMGLAAYDKLFPKYREYGINVVELWMSSWWLALEWINDSPGFHGVGHYNQYRAWMLDYILNLAEENDIYVILVFNNHGKFGTTYDTEWARNPYNIKNGGFLENCEDFYTSEEAKKAFKNTADYIVARWGASPNVMTWKLFTEVDLTGPTIEFYHHPSVAQWHAEMGQYIKSIDPYQHLITTHWMLGYHRINDAIANLPEMDFLTTDAYYNQGSGSRALLKMLKDGANVRNKWKKPLLITEYGGSSYADSMGNLMKQVELGMWAAFFNEAPVLPLYWWFALLEDKNLYHKFSAINKFAKDEDRRGLSRKDYQLPKTKINVYEMKSDENCYLWLFDSEYFFSEQENQKAELHKEVKLSLELKKGNYNVEIFNCDSGEIIQKQELQNDAEGTKTELVLPDFAEAIAVKIKTAASPSAE